MHIKNESIKEFFLQNENNTEADWQALTPEEKREIFKEFCNTIERAVWARL